MSILLNAVLKAEEKLPKVIPTKAHGLLDYGQAAFFLGLGLACRKRNRRAASAGLLIGSFLLVEALLTDYPMGAFKVIPFPMHRRLDREIASALLAIPRIFGFEESGPAALFKSHGALTGALAHMTDAEQTGSGQRAA